MYIHNSILIHIDFDRCKKSEFVTIDHLSSNSLFQMHGYDLPPPSMGPTPGPPPGMIPSSAPPSDVVAHPDSTDSYISYLDSDESMPASP